LEVGVRHRALLTFTLDVPSRPGRRFSPAPPAARFPRLSPCQKSYAPCFFPGNSRATFGGAVGRIGRHLFLRPVFFGLARPTGLMGNPVVPPRLLVGTLLGSVKILRRPRSPSPSAGLTLPRLPRRCYPPLETCLSPWRFSVTGCCGLLLDSWDIFSVAFTLAVTSLFHTHADLFLVRTFLFR